MYSHEEQPKIPLSLHLSSCCPSLKARRISRKITNHEVPYSCIFLSESHLRVCVCLLQNCTRSLPSEPRLSRLTTFREDQWKLPIAAFTIGSAGGLTLLGGQDLKASPRYSRFGADVIRSGTHPVPTPSLPIVLSRLYIRSWGSSPSAVKSICTVLRWSKLFFEVARSLLFCVKVCQFKKPQKS